MLNWHEQALLYRLIVQVKQVGQFVFCIVDAYICSQIWSSHIEKWLITPTSRSVYTNPVKWQRNHPRKHQNMCFL